MGLMSQQGGVNLGTAYAEVVIDFSKAEQMANQAFTNMERGLGSKINSIGQSMQLVGRNISLMTAPLTAFVTQGIFAFANFDEILTEIQARTGATAEEMETLKQFAIEMGQETAFSATEASQAMLELLSSGSSLEEAMATLPHVLNLAASSGVGLGESADALTDILAQFQLGVESSAEVVQALSAATQKSSATMPDLIAAFSNVGPIAKAMGLDIDETAAVLAVFAENGIKGSEAGTQLKSMLQNMTRPTEDVKEAWAELGTSFYDAQGNMRPIDDIIDDINLALKDKTPEERNEIIKALGGSYGSMGLEALLASDGIDTMQSKMAEASDVTDLADAKMNSFKGVINQLKSSISTLSIVAIGPLVEDYIKPLIAQMTPLLNDLTAWLQANPELTSQIGLLLAALIGVGPVIAGLGTLLVVITSPITLVALAIMGIVAALGALYIAYTNNLGGFGDKVDSVAAVVIPVLERMLAFIQSIAQALLAGDWDKATDKFAKGLEKGLTLALGVLTDWAKDIKKLTPKLQSEVENLFEEFVDVFNQYAPQVAELGLKLLDSLIGWVGQAAQFIAPKLQQWGLSLISAIGQLIPQVLAAGLELGTAFLEWLGPATRETLPKLGEYIGAILGWLVGTGLPMLVVGAQVLQAALIGWIIDAAPKVIPALVEFLGKIQEFIWLSLIPALIEMGWQITLGLAQGIADGATELWGIVKEFFNGLIEDVKELLGIQSPSTVFAAIGGEIIAGLWAGIEAVWEFFKPFIANLITDFIDNYWTPLSDGMAAIWETINPALTEVYDWFMTNGLPFIETAIQTYIDDYLTPMIDLLSGLWTAVSTSLTSAYNWFVTTGMPFIKTAINETKDAIGELVGKFLSIWAAIQVPLLLLKSNLESIFNGIKTTIDGVKNAIQDLIDKANSAASAVGGVVNAGGGLIGGIINRASGGNYPANQARIVGEAGPELEVPRSSGMIVSNDQLATAMNVLGSQARGGVFGSQTGAGGGVTVNGGVQITIDGSAVPANATPGDVAEAVWEKFTQAIRSQGGGTVSAT